MSDVQQWINHPDRKKYTYITFMLLQIEKLHYFLRQDNIPLCVCSCDIYIMPFVTTWIDQKSVMLSKINQRKKNAVYFHLHVEFRKLNKQIKKTETDTQIKITSQWLSQERGVKASFFTLFFHFHQKAPQFLFNFCNKGGVICLPAVIDISPGNLDSSLCFIQPAFCMMYSAYKLNKQDDNIQP